MNKSPTGHHPTNLILAAETAADLMTKNVASIRHAATLQEAGAFLVANEISGAPVVDDAGRAIGVISHTDIVRHDSIAGAKQAEDAEFYRAIDHRCPPALLGYVYGKHAESTPVRDVMSPIIFQVSTGDAAMTIVAKFLALKIHRLFVADATGTLVGVISTFDVLRCLRRPEDPTVKSSDSP